MPTMKPMLACSTIPDLANVNYPVIISPKLDGIRCLIVDGKAVTRNLKPIPNKFIQKQLGHNAYNGFDGEILVNGDFNSVQSAVMSEYGEPDFTYHIFDLWNSSQVYIERHRVLAKEVSIIADRRVTVVTQIICTGPDDTKIRYDLWRGLGYEGAILRDPDSVYKYGRSTLKQGWMLKLKEFSDDEARIVDFEELMHNDNLATTDNLGHTIRSSHKEGQWGGSTLGALVVEYKGKSFKIGTGFDAAMRQQLWNDRDELKGKLVTFKYQELSKYGIPRFPVFKGIRYECNDD